jgi:hypothetical protein
MRAQRAAPPAPVAPPPPVAPVAPPPAAPLPDGAAPIQPQAPGIAALATLLSPRAAPPGRAIGQSPADKDFLGELAAQRRDQIDATKQALDQQQSIVDAHSAQADALATESKVGAAAFQDQQKKDEELRAEIERHAAERDTRARSELDRLEAQGVNPNHYWQSMGTAQKIGAAVAIGLGAFAAHPLGPNGSASPNVALQIIQNAVAADIDAQKENLQKSLQLAEKRGQVDDKTFNRELAFANAQRDSHQTAYAVIDKDITRRTALVQGNDELKQQALRFQAAVREQGAAQVLADNKEIYAIQKGAERKVGAGNAIGDKIRATAKQIYMDSKGTVPMADALRQAGRLELGVDVAPGTPEPAGWDKASQNAGKLSPRLAARMADLNSAEQSVAELNELYKKGSSLSLDDRAKAQTAAENLRNQGFKTVPENPLEVFSVTGPRQAALASVLRDIRTRKNTLLTMGAGSGDTPDELGLQEDK